MNVQDMVNLSFICCLKIMKERIVVKTPPHNVGINNVEKPSGVAGPFTSMSEMSCWREYVNVRCVKAFRVALFP